MSVSWITPSGFLFTATEASVVNTSVSATGTSNITYEIITGSVPAGLTFSNSGTILGTVTPVIYPTTSTFVVRAADSLSNIKDRTFSIFVPSEEGPVWEVADGFSQVGGKLRGYILTRDFIDIQFTAGAPLVHSDNYPITYSVTSGKIPRGLKFHSDGRLIGSYMRQLIPGTYDTISFTAGATDGYKTISQTIEILAIDADAFRTDATILTSSTGTGTISIDDITIPGHGDLSYMQVPEFINGNNLGIVTANDKHYISVQAFDPDPDKGPVTYSLIPGGTAYQNPPANLNLDPVTGYLYGRIPATTTFQSNYTFGVKAEKIDTATGSSITATNTFTLGVYANDRFTIDPFLVNKWTDSREDVTNRLVNWVSTKNNEVICFCAGPLSKVWIPILYERYPNNIYLDVGSTLDIFLKGETNRHYALGDPGLSNSICDFSMS